MGRIADVDGDEFSVKFTGHEPWSFMMPSFEESTGMIKLDVDLTSDSDATTGIYSVNIEVNSSKNIDTIYNFKVQVAEFVEETSAVEINPTKVDFRGTKPKMRITDIDTFGTITIEFSEPLLVPEDALSMRALSNVTEDLELSVTASDEDM